MPPKNPQHIPRPQNSWILFLNDKRKSTPGANVQEKTIEVARLWHQLKDKDDPEIQKYRELAETTKKNHLVQYPNYTFRPRRKKTKASYQVGRGQGRGRRRANPGSTSMANPVPTYDFGDAQAVAPLMSLPFPLQPQPMMMCNYTNFGIFNPYAGLAPSPAESDGPETPSDYYPENDAQMTGEAHGLELKNNTDIPSLEYFMHMNIFDVDAEHNATDEIPIDPSLLLFGSELDSTFKLAPLIVPTHNSHPILSEPSDWFDFEAAQGNE